PDSNDSLANAQSVSQTGPSSYQGITNPNAIIQTLVEGDWAVANGFGNYFTMRNFGLIEMVSTDNLKTFWDPERDFLQSFCQNYDLQSNGGEVSWDTDDTTGNTNFYFLAQDNV